jgi:molybdenum cofactor biosynthesis enzyme MoaA
MPSAPTLRARARQAAESILRRQAKPVRRLLLATGRDRAPRLPEIVQIESTNICNAKCVFCPRDEMHRRQGIMTFDLFRKIVDECAEVGITHVRVHNYGEPFVDRQLVEKVRYAKEKGIQEVGMISNGSLITEEVARGMIEAGLDAINISVDASGKEVFESTRIGLKYDKVIANIERLVRIRGELGRRRPKLILSFVRQNNSLDEQAFIEHWRAIADKIHITDLHNWMVACHSAARISMAARYLGISTPRPSRRSGTPSPTATRDGSTSKAEVLISADRATCRKKTRRSGSRNSCSPRGCAAQLARGLRSGLQPSRSPSRQMSVY